VTWQTAAVGGADIDQYLPIADYAFLSDCHSTALVSRSGSVDWACFRRFDSPTVFCRLLDHERGGHFSIRPADEATVTRRYLDGTLVLESEVRTDGGVAVLTEAMVMRRGGARDPHHELVRVVTNLCVCDFDTPEHRLQLRSLHPGVTVDDVVAATGFALAVPNDVPVTRLPTDDELHWIREVIDPLGLGEKEVPNP